MKRTIFGFILLFHLLSLYPSFSQAAAPDRVVLTYASFNERGAGAILVAQDQGFFRKHNLDAHLVYVRSGAVALSALASGDTQFYLGSGTGSTLGAIAGGLDAVFVGGLVNRLTGTFLVNPEIKTPSDLKGKNVGIQSVGGGIWMITILVLDHWGLEPKRDGLNLKIIGDEAVLAQALMARVIDASYFGYTFGSILKHQGFTMLADVATLGVPYQSTGVLVRRGFLNSSPEIVERVLKALVEAIGFLEKPENKGAIMKSLAKGLRLPKIEDAADGYEVVKSLYDRRIYPNTQGIQNALRMLGASNEKIRRLKLEEIVDERIVRKLDREGFFK